MNWWQRVRMIFRGLSSRWRVTFLVGFVCLTTSIWLVARGWYRREPPVSVILITLDTTRADRLGAYGYRNGLTAQFDRYAQSGVVFERAYAPAPITLPSHATMLTGLYPPEHGLRVNGLGRLSQEVPSLPEILQSRGYDTAAFVSATVLDATFGLGRGFDVYDGFAFQKASKPSQLRRDGPEVVDQALSWLGHRSARPFFCWIHLFDAHAPYDPRQEQFGERFRDNPYDAGIAVELQQVERVVTYLKEHGLDRNTLVVIAGDHGEGLGEHHEPEHGMFAYDSTLRVPLVFVGSRHCRSGTRISTPVSLVDIAPTLLDIMGARPLKHASGRSLRAALKGGQLTARPCYAEAESPFVFNHWCPLHVVVTDRWKYIQSTRPELYDLDDDPSELKNLAEAAIEERKELEQDLELLQHAFVSFAPEKLQLSEQDVNALRTLGYAAHPVAEHDGARASGEVLKDVKDMAPILEKFERAKDLGLEGKIEETIVLLREIIQEDREGDFLDAAVLLGDCLRTTNHLDEAIAIFRREFEKHPDFEKLGLRLGATLAQQGRLGPAAEAFRKVLKVRPDSGPAHLELARVLVKAKDVAGAEAEFHAAIRFAPKVPFAYLEMGQLHVAQRRLSDAAACFEETLRIKPEDGVALANLLSVLVQLGDFAKAFECAHRAVETDPQSFEARYNLGALLISRNRLREGIEQLHEARKIRPDEPRLVRQLEQAEAALKATGK